MDKSPLSESADWPELVREPDWPDTWWCLKDEPAQREALQRELNAELSAAHPLWGLRPVVIARLDGGDDVLVALEDGRLAFVHLVWHGRVDPIPNEYPRCWIPDTWEDLVAALASS